MSPSRLANDAVYIYSLRAWVIIINMIKGKIVVWHYEIQYSDDESWYRNHHYHHFAPLFFHLQTSLFPPCSEVCVNKTHVGKSGAERVNVNLTWDSTEQHLLFAGPSGNNEFSFHQIGWLVIGHVYGDEAKSRGSFLMSFFELCLLYWHEYMCLDTSNQGRISWSHKQNIKCLMCRHWPLQRWNIFV